MRALLLLILTVRASAGVLTFGVNPNITAQSVTVPAGTSTTCFSADNPTLVVNCATHQVIFDGAQAVVLPTLGSAPTAAKGIIYYDTGLNVYRVSEDGATFINLATGSVSGNFVNLQGTTPGAPQSGNANVSGTVISGASSVTGGNGASVTYGITAGSGTFGVAGNIALGPGSNGNRNTINVASPNGVVGVSFTGDSGNGGGFITGIGSSFVALGPATLPNQLFINSNGNVGLGTFSPVTLFHMSSGTLTIDGNTTTALTTVGRVGVGAASPSSILDVSGGSLTVRGTGAGFDVLTTTISVFVSTNGYLGSAGGGVPAFSGCGTTPTIAAGSNNLRGSLVMTSGLSSSCTMTPATPTPSNYFCTFSGGGAGTAVFFQQSANLTVACDNATGLVTCGVGTFVSWTCTGTN